MSCTIHDIHATARQRGKEGNEGGQEDTFIDVLQGLEKPKNIYNCSDFDF
jgi:hypothetical protein